MYGRFQAENFFVTTVTADCTLAPGVDGAIPVQDIPNIEDGKLFYVIFKIDDKDNRFSLPVFLDNGQVKYKGYNVGEIHELKKYDSVGLNDLAENFNYLFKNIDDIGTIVMKGGLDILVYGGIIVNGGETITVPDTTITLNDNATNYVILDYSDSTLKAVSTLANFGQYYFAEITTSGGSIINIELKKSFNVGEFFSTSAFDRDANGAVILKDGSVTKAKINFTGITADDIEEGEEHLLLTSTERAEIEDTNDKKHTHSNKALLDGFTQADRNKLNATSGTNTGDETLASIKNKLGAANASQDGYITKQDWSTFNKKQAAITNNNKLNADLISNGDNNKICIVSTTAPANPVKGDLWYDKNNDLLKTYTGTSWISNVGVDYGWETKTISGGNVELSVRTIINIPDSDFTLTVPATIKDGEDYVVRIINEDDYVMTLGPGITNPRNVDISLSNYATDQFVFLAVNGGLELQPLVATGN